MVADKRNLKTDFEKLLLARKLAIFYLCFNVVTVHKSYEIETNFFGARFVAFPMVSARPKEAFHGLNHVLGSSKPLSLSLWNQIQMAQFC